jgi:CheY-like chemotaxis protein
MRNILLIEDSADYRENIEIMLQGEDYNVVSAACPFDAFKVLDGDDFDVILCDLHLPFILNEELRNYPYSIDVGIRTINELKTVFPNTPIIGISASMPSDLDRIAEEKDFVPLLSKPFSRETLVRAIKRAEHSCSCIEQ